MTWWLPDQWPVHCYLSTTSIWLWHAFHFFTNNIWKNMFWNLEGWWWIGHNHLAFADFDSDLQHNVMPSFKHRSAGLLSVLYSLTICSPPVAILNNKPPCQQQRFRRQDPWKVAQLRPASVVINSFFDAKSDELYRILIEANPDQRSQAYSLLVNLDPSKTQVYQKLSQ